MELTDEVRETYDGYHFGDYEVYNPWSITNYVHRKRLSPFWDKYGGKQPDSFRGRSGGREIQKRI